jgi:hypothetical protein
MRMLALLMSLVSFPVMAEILPCEELLKRVDTKLQTKGVPSYTLEIVAVDNEKNITTSASGVKTTKTFNGKEVGTCEGGTKRLIYLKVD